MALARSVAGQGLAGDEANKRPMAAIAIKPHSPAAPAGPDAGARFEGLVQIGRAHV